MSYPALHIARSCGSLPARDYIPKHTTETIVPAPDHIADLTRAIRASDHSAFTALYDALYPELMRYAWRLTKEEALMYDLVQEAFTILWDRRQTLDPEKSVRALLYRIVRNLAFKQHRRNSAAQHTVPVSEPSVQNEGPAAYDEQVLRARLNEILKSLSDRRREVFELSRLGSLKHEEIADIMGIAPKTVRNHLVAALHHVREQFELYGIR